MSFTMIIVAEISWLHEYVYEYPLARVSFNMGVSWHEIFFAMRIFRNEDPR